MQQQGASLGTSSISRIKEPKGVTSQSWAHLIAGGAGGMVAACLTSPLDVLKTRLQSEPGRQCRNAPVSKVFLSFRFLIFHFHRTGHDLSSIRRVEGWRALFRGLGPTLSGIVPASAIKFYAYGTSKALISKYMNGGKESAWVHLYAAATAGLSVSTATNPIWVVKTRLQLDRAAAESSTKPALPRYKNSLDCALQVMRQEGIRGFYRGLTASYLGVTESTIQWVLYEQMKFHIARRGLQRAFGGQEDSLWFDVQQWVQKFSAAAGSKLIATGITYPHEVIRTRLRQAPSEDGRRKYNGLIHCCRVVWREEGLAGMYGGMAAHLLRAVPSSAIMFGTYEGVLWLIDTYGQELVV